MPKWADRAKKVLRNQSSQFQERSLKDTIEQARHIVDDIVFVIETSGDDASDVDLSLGGLDRVESFYRQAIRSHKAIELGTDNFERLMAAMLGQYLVTEKNASWTEYTGRHHVLDPVVIRLENGKNVDVFMFCNSLSRKSSVSGARDGRALSSFADSVERMAFP